MKFKVGDKVRIIGNEASHSFSIGEIVTVVGEGSPLMSCGHSCRCSGRTDWWFVYEQDAELIDDIMEEVFQNGVRAGRLSGGLQKRFFMIAYTASYISSGRKAFGNLLLSGLETYPSGKSIGQIIRDAQPELENDTVIINVLEMDEEDYKSFVK